MGTQWNVEADAGAAEMGRLRAAIRSELAAVGADPVGDGELMAWELITNARRHASGDVAVLVSTFDGRVRVEVFDGDPGEPLLRSTDAERVGGHGVEIVDHLSSGWGQVPLGHGKSVWFDLPTEPQP